MTHIHIRRWRADEYDDDPDAPGILTGTLYELTAAPDPESDGLLGPDGRPIERPAPVPKPPMGFHIRECE